MPKGTTKKKVKSAKKRVNPLLKTDETEKDEIEETVEEETDEQDTEQVTESVPAKQPVVTRSTSKAVVAKPADAAGASKSLDVSLLSDAKRMEAILAKQPKVRFHLPLAPGEKKGAYEVVILQGHFIKIPKGVHVNIPEQVADILEKHLGMESEVAERFELGRHPEKMEALG